MKKFFFSTYFDKIISSIIAVGVGLIIYFIIDVRDFVKYKQPYRDELQDKTIREIQNNLLTRIQTQDSINSEKIRYIHYRIDNVLNMMNVLNRLNYENKNEKNNYDEKMVPLKN